MLQLIHQSVLFELTALLLLAVVIGFFGLILRQPLIVSFIAVGIITGPSALGIVHATEHIHLLSELGIAILLFLVGLKLDVKLIKDLGAVSLATGVGQVVFTSVIGFVIAFAMGIPALTALYVAIALTFSSTIIIVKLLSDKKEVDSLHGRIALGLLIVQDILVVVALMLLSTLGISSGAEQNLWIKIAQVIGAAIILLILIALFMRYIADTLLKKIAHSPELLICFAIAWTVLLCSLGEYFGFGKELGGLVAGMSLASTPYREAIISRLSSLRDFLLLFFFITLGSMLDLGMLGHAIVPAIVLSLFVLIGNPIIVMAIMGVMGFRKRTGFMTGLTVAQISEFSLIFMAMGLSLGHVNAQALGLVTLVGLITIAMSVYMITYSNKLYQWLEPVLGIFERKRVNEQLDNCHPETLKAYDYIVLGLGRYGKALALELLAQKKKVMVIDFNPKAIADWKKQGHDAIYGDINDTEFLHMLPLRSTQWLISTLPHSGHDLSHNDPRMILLKGLKAEGFKGKIAIFAHSPREEEKFKKEGADVICRPFKDAAEAALTHIKAFNSAN